MTGDEHARQRELVDMSLRRSSRQQERRDETAALARLYAHPRERVTNIVPFIRPDEPPPVAA
jgi:hypothetical protein